jgi:cation diffusion facilitator family transporter
MNKHKKIKLASIIGIIANIFLLIIKAIIGIISKSQAMLADSFNSAGDIFSSLMTFIGNKIASRPRDDDHNLGHGKAEYIYSMLISIIMILSSFLILKSSFSTLIYKKTYIFSIWLIIVCIVTIITKASLFIYTNRLAKKYNNILVKANSRDHLIDTLITTLNLISCLFAKYNIYYLDGIVGILIALWIIISSLNIFRESYDVLMDKSISEDTKREVLEIIKKYDEIKRVNHFNSTPVGYRYQISFTIFVDGSMSTFESHEIADKLEKEITKTFDDIYLTVIHVNPIDTKKES